MRSFNYTAIKELSEILILFLPQFDKLFDMDLNRFDESYQIFFADDILKLFLISIYFTDKYKSLSMFILQRMSFAVEKSI